MENKIGQPRTDRLTAAKVERGLYVQRAGSTRAAANYMFNNGVPLHVAVRVLTTPHRREMSELLKSPPSWHDIISSAGSTFGVPVRMR